MTDAHAPRVAIIGCGMAGLLSAWLLVSAHGVPAAEVAIFERRRARWKLPRAAGCGDDSRRLLLACLPRAEIDPALQEIVREGFHYAWRDADLEVLYESKLGDIGLCGWPMIVGMNQFELEDILERHLRAAGVRINFDYCTSSTRSLWAVAFASAQHLGSPSDHTALDSADQAGLERLDQSPDHVDLTFSHRDSSGVDNLRVEWVLGCDGAASPVREMCGIKRVDWGFEQDWLVIDLLPSDECMAMLNAKPYYQLCDPRRPATIIWSGPGRRRFEFMRVAGETAAELNTLETAWRLLAPYGVTPANCKIERSACYTFKALLAESFIHGRCVLAGDAPRRSSVKACRHASASSHALTIQMGMRDAANLAWRLALILKGKASAGLLPAYEVERHHQSHFYIDLAIELGKVICITDPDEAKRVHADLRANPAPQTGFPRLGQPGTLTDHPLAGVVSFQRPVDFGDGRGAHLLDDLTTPMGWRLFAWCGDRPAPDPSTFRSARARAFAQRVGLEIVAITPAADVTGEYGAFFRERAHGDAMLVRPDLYCAGVSAGADELEGMLEAIDAKMSWL